MRRVDVAKRRKGVPVILPILYQCFDVKSRQLRFMTLNISILLATHHADDIIHHKKIYKRGEVEKEEG